MTNPKREIFLALRSQTGDREAFDELLKIVTRCEFCTQSSLKKINHRDTEKIYLKISVSLW